MPISQATILSIYGDLCTIVDAVEKLRSETDQLDLFTSPETVAARIRELTRAAHETAIRAQRSAIIQITSDDHEIQVNPVSGRIE